MNRYFIRSKNERFRGGIHLRDEKNNADRSIENASSTKVVIPSNSILGLLPNP